MENKNIPFEETQASLSAFSETATKIAKRFAKSDTHFPYLSGLLLGMVEGLARCSSQSECKEVLDWQVSKWKKELEELA